MEDRECEMIVESKVGPCGASSISNTNSSHLSASQSLQIFIFTYLA